MYERCRVVVRIHPFLDTSEGLQRTQLTDERLHLYASVTANAAAGASAGNAPFFVAAAMLETAVGVARAAGTVVVSWVARLTRCRRRAIAFGV